MRPNIEEIRGLGDFATVYQWNISIIKQPTVLSPGQRLTSSELNLRCISTDLPKVDDEKIMTNIRGHKVKQAGQATYSDALELQFAETINNKIHLFLSGWMQACWRFRTGVHVLKADAEATFLWQRLDRQDNPIWWYKTYGTLIQAYNLPKASNENQGFQPSMTVTIDYFEEGPGVGAA